MKKNSIVATIIRIVGIAIIAVGIIMTVIPMFNFNVFTFKLGKSIVFALGFSFIGIVLIIISVIYKTISGNYNSIKTTTDEIAEKIKRTIQTEKQNADKKCPYCDSPIPSDIKKCQNCGAKIK